MDNKIIDIEEAHRRRKEQRAAARSKRRMRPRVQADIAEPASKPLRWWNKIFIYGRRALFAAAAIGVISFALVQAVNLIQLSDEAAAAEAALAEREAEKVKMEKQLELTDDPAFIEQQARDRLRMIRQDETLYVFGEPEEDA